MAIWQYRYLRWIDWRSIPLLFALMAASLLVISTTTKDAGERGWGAFFTPYVISQLKWYSLGWMAYIFFAGMDYRKLKKWAFPLYLVAIAFLVGLFFTSPFLNVHRWYRIPGLGVAFQ